MSVPTDRITVCREKENWRDTFAFKENDFTYDRQPVRSELFSILEKPFAHCVPERNLIPTASPSSTLDRAHLLVTSSNDLYQL